MDKVLFLTTWQASVDMLSFLLRPRKRYIVEWRQAADSIAAIDSHNAVFGIFSSAVC